MQRQNFSLSIAGIVFWLLFSDCDRIKSSHKNTDGSTTTDSTSDHRYNELANPKKLKTLPISDYNTDNPEIKNIARPNKSVISSAIDTSLLFAIWTSDPNAPNASFVFSNKSFFVVDYDGDGDMPYTLINKKLKIYYNDFIQDGEIISVDKDSLKIKWQGYESPSYYTKWKN